MLKPYKNRNFSLGQQVEVYRNLHNGMFSLRDPKTKLVIAHGENFVLKNAIVKYLPSGQKKAIETNTRNVHAYIIGELTFVDSIVLRNEISYNPFGKQQFTFKNGKEFIGSELVYFNKGKCYVVNEVDSKNMKKVKKNG